MFTTRRHSQARRVSLTKGLPTNRHLSTMKTSLNQQTRLFITRRTMVITLTKRQGPIHSQGQGVPMRFMGALSQRSRPITRPPSSAYTRDPSTRVIRKFIRPHVHLLRSRHHVKQRLMVGPHTSTRQPTPTRPVTSQDPQQGLIPRPNRTQQMIIPINTRTRQDHRALILQDMVHPNRGPPTSSSRPNPMVKRRHLINRGPLRHTIHVAQVARLHTFTRHPTARVTTIFDPRHNFLLRKTRPRNRILLQEIIIITMFRITIIRMDITRHSNLRIATHVIPPQHTSNGNLLPGPKRMTRRMFNVLTLLIRIRFRIIRTHRPRRHRFITLQGAHLSLRLSISVIKRRQRTSRLRRRLRMKLPRQGRVKNFPTSVSTTTRPSFQHSRHHLRNLLFKVPIPRPRVRRKARHPKAINQRDPNVRTSLTSRINVSSTRQATHNSLHNRVISVKSLSTIRMRFILQETSTTRSRIITVTRKQRQRTKVKTRSTQSITINTKALLSLPRTSRLRSSKAFNHNPRQQKRSNRNFRLHNILLRLSLSGKHNHQRSMFQHGSTFMTRQQDQRTIGTKPCTPRHGTSNKINQSTPLLLPSQRSHHVNRKTPHRAISSTTICKVTTLQHSNHHPHANGRNDRNACSSWSRERRVTGMRGGCGAIPIFRQLHPTGSPTNPQELHKPIPRNTHSGGGTIFAGQVFQALLVQWTGGPRPEGGSTIFLTTPRGMLLCLCVVVGPPTAFSTKGAP